MHDKAIAKWEEYLDKYHASQDKLDAVLKAYVNPSEIDVHNSGMQVRDIISVSALNGEGK